MTHTIRLAGLEGTNPLGYFAALGLLNIAERMNQPFRLSWSREPVPRAIGHTDQSPDALVEMVMNDREEWLDAPALNRFDDIKLDPSRNRSYIAECGTSGGRSRQLVAGLVAEGTALDGKGNAKPTDLHFTAGQQKFLVAAREIRDGLSHEHVLQALTGPWSYSSPLKSLMWDVTDDRVYALAASDPSKLKKMSVPGAEWLALQGVASIPCFADELRTHTTGASGSWKFGEFTWLLWSPAVGVNTGRTVVGQAQTIADNPALGEQLGVSTCLRSTIRRSDQGGYGTFGPPKIIWQISEHLPMRPLDDRV